MLDFSVASGKTKKEEIPKDRRRKGRKEERKKIIPKNRRRKGREEGRKKEPK